MFKVTFLVERFITALFNPNLFAASIFVTSANRQKSLRPQPVVLGECEIVIRVFLLSLSLTCESALFLLVIECFSRFLASNAAYKGRY